MLAPLRERAVGIPGRAAFFESGAGGLDRPFAALTPHEVLDACQAIERELGRNRAAEAIEKATSGAPYCSRPIDIDVIFYDDAVFSDERLTVPHPHLAEREFALVPLNEIMRQHRHPVTGQTVGEMLESLRKG